MLFYLLNSPGDFMKKLSEIGQQKPADDAVPADSEEQSAKRLKVTDELRYFLSSFKSRHSSFNSNWSVFFS